MRIDPSLQYLGNIAPDGVGNAPGQSKIPAQNISAGEAPDSSATQTGDSVQFSSTLNQVQQLTAQLAQTPDVRASRVAALQQQVQQGAYDPSNEQIANALMAELFGTGGQG